MASEGIPIGQVIDVLSWGREADKDRMHPVRVSVVVDALAPRELVFVVRDAFLPVREGAEVDVLALDKSVGTRLARPDLCVIVAGGTDEQVRSVAAAHLRAGAPVAVVAETSLDAALPASTDQVPALKAIVSSDVDSVRDALARFVAQTSEHRLAFAASFPFCRKATVDYLVQERASQNAAIGAIGTASAPDMTLMTASQAKLALDIAAAYGRPLTFARAHELLGVVGAGMGYRAVARTVGAVLPKSAWAFKATVAYLGTLSTARALQAHFERQDSGQAPLPRVRAALGQAASALSALPLGEKAPDASQEATHARVAPRLPQAQRGEAHA